MMDDIKELEGKTLKRIVKGGDYLIFETEDNQRYAMWHMQDCCENVYIEDMCGDLTDLVGSEIILAEERGSDDPPNILYEGNNPESYTWTFYEIKTNKGSVTIRWYGESNGYYSESVSFLKEGEWGFDYFKRDKKEEIYE